MLFEGKDLLALEPLTREQIELVLDTAEPFKEISERAIKKVPTLRGATVVNLFFEASTRTRTSFEIAAKRLGADAVSITASGSSVTKGESLVDTLNTLGAMRPDAIVSIHADGGPASGSGFHVNYSSPPLNAVSIQARISVRLPSSEGETATGNKARN